MIAKPSRTALLGMAVLFVLILAACSNGPSLHFVTVTPASGTIFFSSAAAAGVKGAPATRNSTRQGAVVVSPQDLSTASCGSLQFQATAFFSDGHSVDETNAVTWGSSNPSVASISPSGRASGHGLGTSTIGASFNTVPASPASLEVDELNTISMKPLTATIASGGSQSFQALGNFTLANGSTSQQDISSNSTFGTTWMSSNMNLVTVDQNGKATSTGNGSGQVTITATSCDGATMGTATLGVGAPPVTLNVTPMTPTIATGSTIQFMAAHSDGSPLTGTITWQSLSTGVATIDANSGLAAGVASGSSMIMATESGTNFTGNATLTVQTAAARFAYLGNLDTQTISNYMVSAGAVTANTNQNPFTPGTPGPQQVFVHPSGDFLYYIDLGCSLQTVFINSTTGVLTYSNRTPTPTSAPGACAGVMDPLGVRIYVLSESNKAIYGFTITQPSALTKMNNTYAHLTPITGMTPLTDASLNFPDWLMIDRTGQFAYVVNNAFDGTTQHQGTINQYSIDSAGLWHALSPASVNVGNGSSNGPFFGTIDRHNNLFVANLGTQLTTDETVSAFSIGAGGQLTSLGADTQITGAKGTINVITSPVADNMYVLDATGAQVFAFNYTISGTPAAITLTAISGGASQPTGANTDGMAVDPTGTLLLVDDFGVNPAPPTPPTLGSVFVYTVGANGGLSTAPTTVPAGVGAEFVTFYTALAGQ